MSQLIEWAEKGRVPDFLIRQGIRMLLRKRLADEAAGDVEARSRNFRDLVEMLRSSAIAEEIEAANAQHYEVPAAFYHKVLGRRLKYSSAWWGPDTPDLDAAEEAMLEHTGRRAELADGQDILELGCGWGSLTLWMASRYPQSRITAVSNSASQREFIEARAAEEGIDNLEVLTRDVNHLELDRKFDRVVSVEMFEHVRNYQLLMEAIGGWLKPDGKLFVHIFCHRYLAYPFVPQGAGDWMARNFFTGGLMPSADTLLWFQDDLAIEKRWLMNGRHYAKTARAWLDRLDGARDEVVDILAAGHGREAAVQARRWRIFFMACEELFAFRGGNEWLVAHYLFTRR